MPFNGSGVFQRVRNWVADATAGIKIRADYHDNEDDGFAAGLTNCITKDGQTIITQNIPFNSKRATGLADPVNPQDAATKASAEAYANTKLTTLPPPVNAGDATNKTYVDAGDAAANAAAAAAQSTANTAITNAAAAQSTANTATTNAAAANANANNRVLRTGDTMTGPLTVNSTITSSAGITAGGALNAMNGIFIGPSTGRVLMDANVSVSNGAATITVFRGSDAALITYGGAYKPGGGSWADTSDARIKNVESDYPRGLAEVAQLRPVYFTFKGNDTDEPPVQSVPYPNSAHNIAARAGTKYAGLIAQEAEAVFPEIVARHAGYIDGAAVDDLRNIDSTALTYAFINAFKELKARVEALETGGAR